MLRNHIVICQPLKMGISGIRTQEYPKFVRQEIIVNAVTHRPYSIIGTEIQVKMFDNRIVVESPGKLQGLVKANGKGRYVFKEG